MFEGKEGGGDEGERGGVTVAVINHPITHLSEFRQVGEREGGGRERKRKGWGNAVEREGERRRRRERDRGPGGLKRERAKVALCVNVTEAAVETKDTSMNHWGDG